MQQKKDLNTVLDELRAELPFKHDILVSPQDLTMDINGHILSEGGRKRHILTDWATTQISNKLSIPTRYLKKCPPQLMAENVNYWMQNNTGENETWMVRQFNKGADNTFADGLIRGFLSDKYSKFDDFEFLEILTGLFGRSGRDYDTNWYRDDSGFHLRVTLPDLTANIGQTLDGKPDTHRVGLHIENSEVGKKSIKIRPMVYRLVCTNGLLAWRNDGELFQQRHVHLNHSEMYGRVGEAITNGLKEGNEVLNTLIEAKQTPLQKDPFSIIEDIAKDSKYSQELTDGIKTAYMQEPGNNVFYVVQSFTRAAQQLATDRRVEVERDAGKMMQTLIKKAAE